MTKDANISRQDFGFRILGCTKYFFNDYLEKGRTINSKYYIALLVYLKEEIAKKWPQMKKSALSPKQFTVSQVDHNSDKTT